MIYTNDEIRILRTAGKRLAQVLGAVEGVVAPGVTTRELDTLARTLIEEGGDTPAFLGYLSEGAAYPFPATLCVSVNDEVVHGIPSERKLLAGDIVGLDIGLSRKGLFVDMARTVGVGDVDENARRLMRATREALDAGIAQVRAGARLGDIGHAIEKRGKKDKFGIIEELGGHGVGHHVHEDPYIANWGTRGTGQTLRAGMVIALEPMFNEGSRFVMLDKDQWTWKTRDKKRSAHFEHTVLVTENGAEVLTRE